MSNDDMATIANELQEDNQRLLQENDDLRAVLLEAPNAQMVAFIAALGLELDDELKTQKEYDSCFNANNWKHNPDDEWTSSCLITLLERIISTRNELKAKHLNETEVE